MVPIAPVVQSSRKGWRRTCTPRASRKLYFISSSTYSIGTISMTGCPPTQYQQATTGYVPYNRVFADAPSIPYQSYHQSSASTHLNSSYLFRDPKKYSSLEIEMITPKTARNRRKGPSGDQVKHRRTRSGCFTCRSRRVKVNAIRSS